MSFYQNWSKLVQPSYKFISSSNWLLRLTLSIQRLSIFYCTRIGINGEHGNIIIWTERKRIVKCHNYQTNDQKTIRISNHFCKYICGIRNMCEIYAIPKPKLQLSVCILNLPNFKLKLPIIMNRVVIKFTFWFQSITYSYRFLYWVTIEFYFQVSLSKPNKHWLLCSIYIQTTHNAHVIQPTSMFLSYKIKEMCVKLFQSNFCR